MQRDHEHDCIVWVPMKLKPGDPIPPGAYTGFGGGAFGMTDEEAGKFKANFYKEVEQFRAQEAEKSKPVPTKQMQTRCHVDGCKNMTIETYVKYPEDYGWVLRMRTWCTLHQKSFPAYHNTVKQEYGCFKCSKVSTRTFNKYTGDSWLLVSETAGCEHFTCVSD
jgi:hypothetical protein